jgi:hypothetical protein
LNFRDRVGFKTLTLAATFAFLIICAATTMLYLQQRGRLIEKAVVTGSGSVPAPASEQGSISLPSETLNDNDSATASPPAPPNGQTEKRGTPDAGEKKAAALPPPQNAQSNTPSLNDRPPQSSETTARAKPSSQEDNVAPSPNSPTERESTRDLNAGQKAMSLSEMKKIYVEVAGDEPLGQSLRTALMNALRVTGGFLLTANRDEADALFKVSLDARPDSARRGDRDAVANPQVENRPGVGDVEVQRVSVVVRLVNASGEVIWPVQGKNSGGRYEGSVRDVAAKITRDMLGEIHRPER